MGAGSRRLAGALGSGWPSLVNRMVGGGSFYLSRSRVSSCRTDNLATGEAFHFIYA